MVQCLLNSVSLMSLDLKSLNLTGEFNFLLNSTKSLEIIKLFIVHRQGGNFNYLLKGKPLLENLYVGYCPNLCSLSLRSIQSGKLKELHIYSCSGVNHAELIDFLNQGSPLIKLSLKRMYQICLADFPRSLVSGCL